MLGMPLNITILGGNGERQSVGAVARAFRRAGHQVNHVCTLPGFFPAPTSLGADVDLLFTFKIGEGNIPAGFIKSLPIKHKVFWNFDDPYWISNTNDPAFAKEHDVTLTSCLQSVDEYRGKGAPWVYFLPPAMDPEYYHGSRLLDDRHPISFICTNLYKKKDFPDNVLDRSWMVKVLYAKFKNAFNLWGYGREIESKAAWRGRLEWETNLPTVIRTSQININNHCIGNQRLYMNERFCQIIATKRAQFVDRLPGYTEVFGEESFVYYSSLSELEDKITYYMDHPRELDRIGNAGFEAMKGWTYDAFVQEVLNTMDGKHAFPTFLK